MNDQAPAAEQQATAVAPAKPLRRLGARVVRVALLATMTVALGIWAADWARTALLFVHETDARVAADMISVSSRVDGWLIARPVGSGDTVAKGDTLAVIDSRDAEARLGDTGRLVIRESGTEPLIRVMAEGRDEALIEDVVNNIVDAIERAA